MSSPKRKRQKLEHHTEPISSTARDTSTTTHAIHERDEVEHQSQPPTEESQRAAIAPVTAPRRESGQSWLEIIPPEIRAIIYDYLNTRPKGDKSWVSPFGIKADGRPGDLIQAVRPLLLAHDHALQYFRREAVAVLDGSSRGTGYDLRSLPMTMTEINSLRKLHIILQIRLMTSNEFAPPGAETKDSPRLTWFTSQFKSRPDIEEVRISVDITPKFRSEDYVHSVLNTYDENRLLVEWTLWCQGFKKLKRCTLLLPGSIMDYGHVREWRLFYKHNILIEEKLRANYSEQRSHGLHPLSLPKLGIDEYTWTAEDGKFMDWSRIPEKVYEPPRRRVQRGLTFWEVDATLGFKDGWFVLKWKEQQVSTRRPIMSSGNEVYWTKSGWSKYL